MTDARLSRSIAAALSEFDRFGPDDPLSSDEEQILSCLGAAVVAEWNALPRDLQRRVFERASSLGEPAARRGLRQELALFLHDHHERTAHAPNSR
jgi:hypothetical protein